MKLVRLLVLGAMAAAATGCERDTDGSLVAPDALASLRYVNLVADTGAMDFRVIDIVGDAPNTVGASFRTGGAPNGVTNPSPTQPPYLPVRAGTRQIRVFMNGTSAAVASTVMFDTTFNFVAGTKYTMFLYGYARTGGGGIRSVITTDNPTTPAAGKFKLRLVNLAGDLANNPGGVALGTGYRVDARAALTTTAVPLPGAVSFGNSGFGDVSSYVEFDTSSFGPAATPVTSFYRLALTSTGATSPLAIQTLLPTGVRGTSTANPTAGSGVVGTVMTAVLVPRSVAGSAAPQTAALAVSTNIDSLTRSTDTVTVWRRITPGNGATTCNTAVAAGVVANDIVSISGLTQPEYNGPQAIISVTAGTSLTAFGQQTVTLAGATPGATFRLTLNGQQTLPIPMDATPATVEAVLGAVAGPTNVSVTGATGGPYTVLFQGTLSGASVALMSATATAGTATPALLPVGCSGNVNTRQVVTLAGGVANDSFRLNMGGQQTAFLAFTATAAQVQAALVALSTVGTGTGNATVTGSAGGPYTVTFAGTFVNQNVATMTASTKAGSVGTAAVAKSAFTFSGTATSSRFRYRIAGLPAPLATGAPVYRIVTAGATADFTIPSIIVLLDRLPDRTAP